MCAGAEPLVFFTPAFLTGLAARRCLPPQELAALEQRFNERDEQEQDKRAAMQDEMEATLLGGSRPPPALPEDTGAVPGVAMELMGTEVAPFRVASAATGGVGYVHSGVLGAAADERDRSAAAAVAAAGATVTLHQNRDPTASSSSSSDGEGGEKASSEEGGEGGSSPPSALAPAGRSGGVRGSSRALAGGGSGGGGGTTINPLQVRALCAVGLAAGFG